MADEKPQAADGGTPDSAAGPPMEAFGPVSSLEPDAATPLPGGSRERITLTVTWESAPEASPPETARGAKAAGKAAKPDWSHAPAADGEAESEEDPRLLDDGFLKRTFKPVSFPASKELCLRYVDQEQDFAFGQDRTVNLHNLIAHLEAEEFATRRDLLKAIKGRLSLHGTRPSA